MKRFIYLMFVILLSFSPAYCTVNEEEISDYQEQAKLYYNTNNIAQCMEMLTKIPDSKKGAQDWVLLANIAQDREKPLDAIFFLERAIIADSKYYKAYYNLGNIYFETGNISKAMENFRKAVKLKEDFAYAYYNMGCCYLKRENYRLARYYFANAIKYNASEPSFFYNISYTYKMLKNKKRAEETLKIYNELMQQ